MKKRMIALLLAMLMVLGMSVCTVSAKEPAQLALSAKYSGSLAVVEVAVKNAAGMTDGQIVVEYNAQELELKSAYASSACGAASVKTSVSGKVTMVWVGSKLTDAQTLLLTVEFTCKKEAVTPVTATVNKAYASGTPLMVKGASVTLPSSNPFVDIDGHWAKNEILLAYHAGLFNGMSANEFGPEVNLTRGMFVTVLYRMDGSPEVSVGDLAFDDVKASDYYANAVVWASSNGVTNGTSETTFTPSQNITRQELVTMLYRYAQYKGEDVSAAASVNGFTDAKDISAWALSAMKWAVAEKLITGYPDGTVLPQATANRAQTAVILCRYTGLA